MKPVLKWVGGKSQLIDEIIANLPSKEIRNNIITYVEPFIGGAAVMINLLQYFPNLKKVIIADYNKELINFYNVIKNYPIQLCKSINTICWDYTKEDNDPEKFFYNIREVYNGLKNTNYNIDFTLSIQMATYFVFLNKTCYNGLYRENQKGGFNVPWNKNKEPFISTVDINELSELFNRYDVQIIHQSYTDTLKDISKNTFVYMDPPYRPINKTSSFTAYTKSGFNDNNQIELSEFCNSINNVGSYFMLSNSDPHNTDETDNFFDDLYKNYNIKRVYANRNINSNGAARGKISELLITNY